MDLNEHLLFRHGLLPTYVPIQLEMVDHVPVWMNNRFQQNGFFQPDPAMQFQQAGAFQPVAGLQGNGFLAGNQNFQFDEEFDFDFSV
jgi:hypothetical protein